MEYLICMAAGYLLGTMNPSFFISKIKNTDLRMEGTKNLGATNAFMVLGKGSGTGVLLFDILKAFFAVRISAILFPGFILAGVIAGTASIVGHIFPFYLNFKGGKGVACLGGLVLGLDWRSFIVLLLAGCILAFIFNWGCLLSFFASAAFPVLYAVQIQSIQSFLILSIGSICIVYKHMENIRRIRDGKELPVRAFLKQYIVTKKNGG